MMSSLVLQIVVESSVLDLMMINEKIRSLSKEFRVIGSKAMEEHATYQKELMKINSGFKFHYCSLCEKPHVADGSWKDDLCHCHLDENLHAQEISRRTHLQVVGDPRLDPSFASLSTETKFVRMIKFVPEFSWQAIGHIVTSGWLYEMSCAPLFQLNLALSLKQWNETALNLLIICIYVDVLRKEFCSMGPRCTTLLDLALQVLENDSEVARYQELLDDDEAAMATFLGDDEEKLKRLLFSIHQSFMDILSLHASGDDSVLPLLSDLLKNLGNSIGMFLTERDNNAPMFLERSFIDETLRRLPETFVWIPEYGGNREDYVPPVNQFAHYATQG